MRPTKWLIRDNKVYEIRYQRIGRSCQIWVFEGEDRPLGVHSTVSLYDAAANLAHGRDLIAEAMDLAAEDVANGHFTRAREMVAAE